MNWLLVYSNDIHGNTTFGSLPELLEDIREGADIGVVHRGEIVRRFFPVQQVLIRDNHAYAVVHTTIFNVVPDKEGAIKWETKPDGMTVVYCSNGKEYWNCGESSVRTHLDWFALTDRIDKPRFPRSSINSRSETDR